MNWTLVALILCSVAALGWTEIHQCCTPPKWSGAVDIHVNVGGQRQPVVTIFLYILRTVKSKI